MVPRHATPDLCVPVEACRPPFEYSSRFEVLSSRSIEHFVTSHIPNFELLNFVIIVLYSPSLFNILSASVFAHPDDPDDLLPRRMAGNDLHLGFGNRRAVGEKLDQRFIRRVVHGRGREPDLEPAALHPDDLVLRCARAGSVSKA